LYRTSVGNCLTEASNFWTGRISIRRTRNMARFIYIASLLLLVALCQASTNDDDTSDSEDPQSGKDSQTTEGKAGEAIKTLLQEKITQKFKEAANEVKGVLVKQLGDSLKSAHDAFNPPKELLKKVPTTAKATDTKPSGAAKIHQNKANRHRKNSGPQGTPNSLAPDSPKLIHDVPNLIQNVSHTLQNGSNLFPNAPLLLKDSIKSMQSGPKLLRNATKCPKGIHVLLRFKFNRHKACSE